MYGAVSSRRAFNIRQKIKDKLQVCIVVVKQLS